MVTRQEFDKVVEDSKTALSQIASYSNTMKAKGIPETGPISEDIEADLKDPIIAVSEAIDQLTLIRNEMAITWLRTRSSRVKLSEISGLSMSAVRRMSEIALEEVTEE